MPAPRRGEITFTLGEQELSDARVNIWAVAGKLGLGAVRGKHLFLTYEELLHIQKEMNAAAADPFAELLLKAAKLILGSVKRRPPRRKAGEEPAAEKEEDEQALAEEKFAGEEEQGEPLRGPTCKGGSEYYLASLAKCKAVTDLEDVLVAYLDACSTCPLMSSCPSMIRMIVVWRALNDLRS